MGLKWANNAEATLAAGINNTDPALTVTTGQGTRFPLVENGDYFYATLVKQDGTREIIKVTEHVTATIDQFTVIERAVDAIASGTATAYSFSTGDRVQIRIPAIAILSPDATKSDTFQIGSDTTGPTLKNNSSVLEVRNAADSAYANLKAAGLTLTSALALGGAITGATNITMTGTLAITGGLTATTNCALPIDNESAGHAIKAADHGTATNPEVVNVVYGTGSPPAAGSVPEGTIFIKYL